MIAVFNSLPVREGAAERVVEMFRESRGSVQNFPGFVSMEVLSSEDGREVVVITRWQRREDFEAWVRSPEFSQAHRSSGDGLFTGHPNISFYEVALERVAD
ncbi:MAG: antibiotic biosynthesis monooxygenase [Rubrobacteraceae bacterium]|uniref:antibiotic biosynthesis monooxygenase family protein n=1 Tax=Rubrobacter naiadicus TaxID=1392641 RepID=UPI0023621ABE|nr:antibiotic biosynthesis monooxygenase [Rubrobacter naiadicus]MBX6762708.1 antibiotic biosynthesis monooxygenase [Rubrobacteraceae bacterium]MCL6439360.1 antibiotic biosynthesis monooxygenase [Rubrobacteraceae bacterium]